MFGITDKFEDFIWPKQEDLDDMPTENPIKVASFNWKKNSENADYIGAIQVVLSNGNKS